MNHFQVRCERCGRKPEPKIGKDDSNNLGLIVECRCISEFYPFKTIFSPPSQNLWVDDESIATDSVKKNIK